MSRPVVERKCRNFQNLIVLLTNYYLFVGISRIVHTVNPKSGHFRDLTVKLCKKGKVSTSNTHPMIGYMRRSSSTAAAAVASENYGNVGLMTRVELPILRAVRVLQVPAQPA